MLTSALRAHAKESNIEMLSWKWCIHSTPKKFENYFVHTKYLLLDSLIDVFWCLMMLVPKYKPLKKMNYILDVLLIDE